MVTLLSGRTFGKLGLWLPVQAPSVNRRRCHPTSFNISHLLSQQLFLVPSKKWQRI